MLKEAAPPEGDFAWAWPFPLSDLTAGLRRYLQDTSIQLLEIRPSNLPGKLPSIGSIQAIEVRFAGREGEGICPLVVKEPKGTTRAGLAGAGRREVGVYHSLAPHLPVRTPVMICGSKTGDWLVLERIPPHLDIEAWSEREYGNAVALLGDLHDRFWGLGADLSAFPWLSRPLETDFEVHVAAAAQALDRVMREGLPRALAGEPARMALLERLVAHVEAIAEPLLEQPMTLLHGDYWPGNIAVLEDGDLVVYDWQLAGVGPGVLDVLTFTTKTAWRIERPAVKPEEIVQLYRSAIRERLGLRWDEPTWARLWDHAGMWRFLQEWLDLLAVTPEPLLETYAAPLERVWLGPIAAAAQRRLG